MAIQNLLHLRSRRSDTNLRPRSVLDPILHQSGAKERPKTGDPSSSTISGRSSTSALAETNPSASATPDGSSTPQKEANARFSLRKFRNASDPQMSKSAKAQNKKDHDAPPVPAMPAPPAIITTAPTSELADQPTRKKTKQKQKIKIPNLSMTPNEPASAASDAPRPSTSSKRSKDETAQSGAATPHSGRVTFDDSARPPLTIQTAPPPYEDAGNSSLALPASRLSESSRSDGSSGDHVYASHTTTHISTTTTIFRLPGRSKKKNPSLFPLPTPSTDSKPRGRGRRSTESPNKPSPSPVFSHSPLGPSRGHKSSTSIDNLPASQSALTGSSTNITTSGPTVLRHNSTQSSQSGQSSPTLQPPSRFGQRGRSSTMSSTSNREEHAQPAPATQSGRTSTSTVGRSSIAGLFNRSLFRQGSDSMFQRNGSPITGGPQTPGSCNSKSNSFQLPRENVVIPERDNDEPPSKYLARLQEVVSRGTVASVLSKSNEPFHKTVLRSYMRSFAFFEFPMDMAIRKLLMDAELPKETQQIDRVIEAFAERYHECNPGIYQSPEKAYFIAFSLLILHTDVFNKNNKHKMQKPDYVKISGGQGTVDGILECFYDNISYTPFIHVEDEVDFGGERFKSHKSRKISFARPGPSTERRIPKEPVDPYTLIIENKLDILRPSLQDVMNLEDPYNYLAPGQTLDMQELGETFFKTGVLQIVSARSRPDAFMSPNTISNPEEASAGVVDIKITKVGVLWRKDPKRKKARSPWQEWGAILTGTQLYFFKNVTWVKNLLNQYDNHVKQGNIGIPVTFKPPLEAFKPDALMSTDDAVALVDSSYKKHKYAFMFMRHGGFEETFLADSTKDMHDWLAKLNYATVFRTAGVRMRGVVAGNYEGQRTRAIRRMDSSTGAKKVQTSTGEVSIQSGKIDTQLAQQILVARRQIMDQKITEASIKIEASEKQLDMLLRNARHFRLLAPVHPRSREQLVLAAGRMAAQLKWVRMEIWRLKCHRDILLLDLSEDNKLGVGTGSAALDTSHSSGLSDKVEISKLNSARSGASQRSVTPSTSQPAGSSAAKSKEYGMEDIFQTPPELSRHSSNIRGQQPWALPPISFDSSPNLRAPDGQSLSTLDSRLGAVADDRRQSFGSIVASPTAQTTTNDTTNISQSAPSIDDGEIELLKEAGLVDEASPPTDPEKSREKRKDREKHRDAKEKSKISSSDAGTSEKSSGDRSKVRRSLHRTLRDSTHVPTHHRSKKGKDSASSAGLADDGSSVDGEILTRSTGSFTVHGKKASVVTFGSEWQSMSAEERLKLRKQAQTDDSRLLTPMAVEDESDIELQNASVLGADRRGSDVSQSTATNASLREPRHERPAQHFGAGKQALQPGDESDKPESFITSDEDAESEISATPAAAAAAAREESTS